MLTNKEILTREEVMEALKNWKKYVLSPAPDGRAERL